MRHYNLQQIFRCFLQRVWRNDYLNSSYLYRKTTNLLILKQRN